MGVCQIIQSSELCLGELEGGDLTITKKKKINENMGNESNSNNPMRLSFSDSNKNFQTKKHKAFLVDSKKTEGGPLLKSKENKDLPQNNYNPTKNKLVSNYTLFQSNNKNLINNAENKDKSGINSVTKDNMLFESFSYVSRSYENSTFIDYYQEAKKIFNLINKIRLDPKYYYDIISNFSQNLGVDETNNYDKFKELRQVIRSYPKNKIDQLLDVLNNKMIDNKSDLLMWSEKIYLAISNYLIDVEEKCIIENNKTANERISERLKGNYICTEFNLNGLYYGEILAWNLLMENIDRLSLVLNEKYLYAAICCFPTKNQYKLRTLMYLINKNNDILKNVMIKDRMENTSKSLKDFISEYNCENLIKEYMDKIISGDYSVGNGYIQVYFNLYTGEKKEEEIQTYQK